MTDQEVQTRDWMTLIQGEYKEMPGLQLTKSQVGRMWGLDSRTRDSLLEALQTSHFLRLTPAGCYVLDEDALDGRLASTARARTPRS